MPTRAVIESRLVGRTLGWLRLVEMSPIEDGTNPDLDDPLAESLLDCGLPLSDPAAVTDGDCLGVPPSRLREFLARAELRLLMTIQQRATMVSQQVGFQSRLQWRDFHDAIQRAITRLDAQIVAEWGRVPGGVATAAIVLQPSDPCDIARNLRVAPP